MPLGLTTVFPKGTTTAARAFFSPFQRQLQQGVFGRGQVERNIDAFADLRSIHSLDKLLQHVNRYHLHGNLASDFSNFRTAQTFGKLQNARIGAVLD